MFIGGLRNLIDEITDAEVVAERVPRLNRHFDTVQDLRKEIEDASIAKMGSVAHGLTRGGTMQRIANIPLSIWAGMHQVDEHAEILRNKRKFYAWLNRHPEYRTGRTVIKDRV